jgi:SnoaL-like domain
VENNTIREALEEHWAASEAADFVTEHEIYHDDAVLEYPQSGERIRGRANIQATRALYPRERHFTIRRILGREDVWITEYVITYDGAPSFTVSVMEFRAGKVSRETQYFGDPFLAAPWRAEWVDNVGDT